MNHRSFAWRDRYLAIRAMNPNHDDKGQFASGDGGGGSIGHGLHEEAGKLAREIIQTGNQGSKVFKTRASEFQSRAADLDARSKAAVSKMTTAELHQSAKDILGFAPPKNWSREKIAMSVTKAIRDRVGAAMRSNV